jgi:hypothetical protein
MKPESEFSVLNRQQGSGDVTTVVCSVLPGRGRASRVRAAEVDRLSALNCGPLVRGSLNLMSLRPTWLNLESAFFVAGEHHYWKAEIEGIPVILNRWHGCPAHVYEVFSEVHLRSALSLRDESRVSLSIPREHVDAERTSALGNLLVWYAAWRWRERFYYAGERYLWLLRHPYFRRYTRRAFQ